MNVENGIKVGPIELAPGVSRLNFWSFIYASFICMLILAGLNIMQPYLLNEILQLPRDIQGTVSGNLGVWQQVVSLVLINPFGWMADRLGRRPLMVFGIVVCGVALALHPYATNIAQLTGCRMLFAVGNARIGSLIAIIANDYPAESSRGTLIGISGSMNGVGVLFVTFVIAQIPAVLTAGGTDAVTAGRVMFVVAALLCIVSAGWFRIGLQPGTPHVDEAKLPWKVLMLSGFRAARNPRISLSYGAAFVGRADVAITGMFLTLWALAAAPEAGLSSAEALAKGGMLLGIISVIGIVWVGIFGLILDRLNRVTGLAIAMGIAGAGYSSMWFVTSPLDYAMLPWFTLLSLGQTSVMVASVTLVGQEAAVEERGTIVAMNAFFGAVGIFLAFAIGGRLFDAVGPSAPFVMAGVVQLILVVVAVAVRIASPGDPHESAT
jgi:MFS family permease